MICNWNFINFKSILFFIRQLVGKLIKLLKFLSFRTIGIVIVLLFGIFSSFNNFVELFVFLFLTISIDYCLENFILTEKIWLSQDYKDKNQQFNEDYYDLYWNFSKIQIYTILNTIAVFFPIIKKLTSSTLVSLMMNKVRINQFFL